MKKQWAKRLLTLAAVIRCGMALLPCAVQSVSAADGAVDQSISHAETAGMYCYHFEAVLSNPCNAGDMDKDAVSAFYFDFRYRDRNGAGKSQNYRFDMSWNGSRNQNDAFLRRNFIRSNDNSENIAFDLWVNGMVDSLHIHLNMDGGERLAFAVRRVTCGGIQVNTTTDDVSSAYSDSDAYIGFSMAPSRCTVHTEDTDYTQKQMEQWIADAGNGKETPLGLRDQYGSLLSADALSAVFLSKDGDINQTLRHSDEISMYCYTIAMQVTNPVNIADADEDAIEAFCMDFRYRDENGYASKEKTYRLDMSWDGSRNRNAQFLSDLRKMNDESCQAVISVWVPGIVSQVDVLLNMAGGERLSIDFTDIRLNGYKINTDVDDVSSCYYDSRASIPCKVPSAQFSFQHMAEAEIIMALTSLEQRECGQYADQYGSLLAESVQRQAFEQLEDRIYQGSLNETVCAYFEEERIEKRKQASQ